MHEIERSANACGVAFKISQTGEGSANLKVRGANLLFIILDILSRKQHEIEKKWTAPRVPGVHWIRQWHGLLDRLMAWNLPFYFIV